MLEETMDTMEDPEEMEEEAQEEIDKASHIDVHILRGEILIFIIF